jgi:hypothetical protein
MKPWMLRWWACLAVALTAAALVANPVAVLATGQRVPDVSDNIPLENLWYRITPSVVWCGDANDKVKVEVHIVCRSDVASVQFDNRSKGIVTLYDDATHGDAAAGDNVFTITDVQLDCQSWQLSYEDNWGPWWAALWVILDNSTKLEYGYQLSAGVVHQRLKNRFAVQTYGSGLSATNYAFFIQDSQRQVMGGYPVAEIFCGKSNFEAYKKLYSVFADLFDIAILVPGMPMFKPTSLGEQVPYQVQVRNDVQHIGLPIMNNTAAFGSAGRLKSTVYHSFGSLSIMDHEIAHTWGAGIGSSLGLIEEDSPGRFHWAANSDIGGQLGYYYRSPSGQAGHFAYNGDGTWRFVLNSEVERYAPLELYVMGLIPPEQVPPVHLLTNPNFANPNRITAASVQTVTIQQIMAAEGGARNPASSQSPSSYRVAFIVTQDTAFDSAAYAFYSLMSAYLMTHDQPGWYSSFGSFHWATGGRGSLDTHLPINLAGPTRRVIYLPLSLLNR